ncbi:MAG TPA: hypothetical protein VJN02_01440 [Gammaproteobacteria bacterium]|nr:hypothetical protein [Gammaproteobacteria bacterium]
MMRYIVMYGLLILLTNCAVTTSKHTKSGQEGWRGSSIRAFINRFGVPNAKILTPEGNTIYFYIKTSPRYDKTSAPLPVGMNVSASGKPTMIVKPEINTINKNPVFTCAIVLIVNRQGEMISSKMQGINCKEW